MAKESGGSRVDDYLNRLIELLDRFRITQRDALGRAAEILAERLQRGGVLHLFGTGHSHMIAEEIFYRAGGLVPVNAMLDTSIVLSGGAMRSTETERPIPLKTRGRPTCSSDAPRTRFGC